MVRCIMLYALSVLHCVFIIIVWGAEAHIAVDGGRAVAGDCLPHRPAAPVVGGMSHRGIVSAAHCTIVGAATARSRRLSVFVGTYFRCRE